MRRRLPGLGNPLIWLGLGIFVALALGIRSPLWQLVEFKVFDLLSVLTAPRQSSLPITIIGIDETSFAEIGQQWPWPRSLHAQLIDRLREEGAAVIAFDVLFAEPAQPEEDHRFAAAIERAGNVVLAADLVYRENALLRQWVRVDPIPLLQQAGARPGMAGFSPDADAVVRRIPDYGDAFWREIIATFNTTHPGILGEPAVEPGSLIRHLGPDHTFPYVSYYQALQPRSFLPKDVFKDHIVLIGRDIDAAPETDAAQPDMFLTSFTLQTRWLTPGVEIHATVLENALMQAAIIPIGGTARLILLALSLAAAALLMRNWRPLPSAGVVFALLLLLAGLAWALFEHGNRWLPIAGAASGVILVYLGQGAVAFLLERRRRQELKLAFSRYVAPQVIEEILEHPERLALGGERREITIMFTDLAGFTALSEQLSPEQVAQLLIQHFTAMTAIIQRYGGTVDKFIGDAIMAFWGAPISDPEQCSHACQAALEMRQSLQLTCATLRQQGLPAIQMRIGIHSGEAIVGNMGSESRFDYTAVGDNVNLASRVEGINKLYGTDILLTDTTANSLGGTVPLRRVDRVCVKGKSKPVEIFTLAPDKAPLDLNEAAIAAYRKRDWEGSAQYWLEWLELVPRDGVAQVYLKRIEGLRREPPAADWDGSIALEKM